MILDGSVASFEDGHKLRVEHSETFPSQLLVHFGERVKVHHAKVHLCRHGLELGSFADHLGALVVQRLGFPGDQRVVLRNGIKAPQRLVAQV